MGKEGKGNILSAEKTAVLLREVADRISGVGTEFDSDNLPSNGGFRKLKLSLKRVKDSNQFEVKCKVKPSYEGKAGEEGTSTGDDRPQSVQEEDPHGAVRPAELPGVEPHES